MAVLDDVTTAGWSLDLDWSDESVWHERLQRDRAVASKHQSAEQQEITETLIARARERGVLAFALTGSTARARRTAISDLDYHVIGPRPHHTDLAEEIDIYATDLSGFWRKLNQGDDYIQWTLRYGCILFDHGAFREGMRYLARDRTWPSASPKFARLGEHIRLARRLIAMGDRDAAHDQVRATLTSLARGILLDAGTFPLARSELPAQLEALGLRELCRYLEQSIEGDPTLGELSDALDVTSGHPKVQKY